MPLFFLCLGFAVIFLFFLVPGFTSGRRKKKLLTQFREQWGKPVDTFRNFFLIQQFSSLQDDPDSLPEQTRTDIDFGELFCFLDRTGTCVGQQYLYHTLATPKKDIKRLQQFHEQVSFFAADTASREETQLLLSPLAHQDAHYISGLLRNGLFIKPKWYRLLQLNTALVIVMLLLSFKFHVLLIWLMLPFAINIGLHLWNKNNTSKFVRSFPQINRLINISGKLAQKDLPFPKEKAVSSIAALGTFQKRYRLLSFNTSTMDEVSQAILLFIELVKALFLVEVHSFMNCIDELEKNRAAIIELFRYAGGIDVAIAIASVREGEPRYCVPVFTAAGKKMTVKEVYHPLIENCVTNSLSIDGKSILITGSNMSGKTTFIRTVAINTILAQTVYTCFAAGFSIPFVTTRSSIRIDDDVMEGKSFYLAEVEAIHSLINASDELQQHLFVLDEVFKGTNTIERIAAAKAILSYLNKGNHIVLVSTHDLELADLLQTEYDLYHFEEQVNNHELFFDHQIKEGRLTKRNAISLLELSGYPSSVIAEARTIAGN